MTNPYKRRGTVMDELRDFLVEKSLRWLLILCPKRSKNDFTILIGMYFAHQLKKDLGYDRRT